MKYTVNGAPFMYNWQTIIINILIIKCISSAYFNNKSIQFSLQNKRTTQNTSHITNRIFLVIRKNNLIWTNVRSSTISYLLTELNAAKSWWRSIKHQTMIRFFLSYRWTYVHQSKDSVWILILVNLNPLRILWKEDKVWF